MSFLLWKLSSEEEMDATVKKIADLIIKYGMETPAILFFETIKPVAPVGGPLSRVMVAPWLHLIGLNTRPYINTLEEPKNLEKLIKILEKSTNEKKEKKEKAPS